MSSSSKLFQPLRVGNVNLAHRIVMAPLTRFRADDSNVPLPMVAEYYAQRASVPGTLLITEATFISPRAAGYPNVPGLWTDEQLRAWKTVTDAVHAKGSYIFAQLWALGRAANPKVLEKLGVPFASSSAVPISEDAPTPRALEEHEIQQFIRDYASAARAAVEVAGFDGVEIHGANGYLVDQFTQSNANRRTDGWGGSVEKRARFGIEVARAVVDAVGAERTAIRLSPFSTFQGMRMEDPIPQFRYLASELKKLKLAYLHLVESRIQGPLDGEPSGSLDFLLDIWDNQSPVFLAGGFKAQGAKDAADVEYKDKDVAIIFGRWFISNPDLPFRIMQDIEFTPYNRKTFYLKKDPVGYIDYPFSKEFLESQARSQTELQQQEAERSRL